MDSETAPLLIHKNPYDWLDMKWVLALLSLVLFLSPVLPGDIPWYVTTIARFTLVAVVFGGLLALRGHRKSKWIKEVIDNNCNVFFDMQMGMGEGRARGLWDDAGQYPQMDWASAKYGRIRPQMQDQVGVILPACSSVSEISAVIEAIEKESRSYSGLRQIRNGGFAEGFRRKGFGMDP